MGSLLVSLCNLPSPSDTALLTVDYTLNCCAWVSLGQDGELLGCTGLTSDESRHYVLYLSDGAWHVAVLEKHDLTVVFRQRLMEVDDGHSILAHQGYLYVVSTGTEEVLRYQIAADRLFGPLVVWRAKTSGTETHHVNSITAWNGRLVVSAFGPKSGELWSSATDGYIQDIASGVRIQRGIHHPHSLASWKGCLCFCESHTASVYSTTGRMVELNGYARGMCWLADDLVCVGTSIGRDLGVPGGSPGNPADHGEPSGSCGITLLNPTTGRILRFIDLGRFGPEIYDLLPC